MFRFLKKKSATPPQGVLDKARRSHSLLQTESFHVCLDDLENDAWDAFFNTVDDDYEARELLYVRVKTLGRIKEQLAHDVSQGKEQEAINEYNKR